MIEKRPAVNEHQLDLGHITMCSFSVRKEGAGTSCIIDRRAGCDIMRVLENTVFVAHQPYSASLSTDNGTSRFGLLTEQISG